ncbi:MAG: hypothetical protein AAFQ71_04260 [Planctomycetota bacterium]
MGLVNKAFAEFEPEAMSGCLGRSVARAARLDELRVVEPVSVVVNFDEDHRRSVPRGTRFGRGAPDLDPSASIIDCTPGIQEEIDEDVLEGNLVDGELAPRFDIDPNDDAAGAQTASETAQDGIDARPQICCGLHLGLFAGARQAENGSCDLPCSMARRVRLLKSPSGQDEICRVLHRRLRVSGERRHQVVDLVR